MRLTIKSEKNKDGGKRGWTGDYGGEYFGLV